jgi:translation initiation factor IF-3
LQRRKRIARPPFDATPKTEGPRVNEQITVPQVRLIDDAGQMKGVVSRREALIRAQEAGLDHVAV